MLCHFFKNEVAFKGLQSPELSRQATMTLAFLDEYLRFKGGMGREVINQMLGSYIFDTYKRQKRLTLGAIK